MLKDEQGDTIDVAVVLASTDPNLDITTAAGPAVGAQGADNTGALLSQFGYRVVHAANATDALALYEKGNVDLVFSDIVMPGPMDGLALAREIRSRDPAIPILLNQIENTEEPLRRLAAIVRGADTARPDLAPEASGLLAASLGLSRMFTDDLAQLDAGMTLYDAFYRWCRDATEETHTWHKKPGA